jgi:YfiH family protein
MPTISIEAPQPSLAFAWTQPSPAVGRVLTCGPLADVAPHFFTTASVALRADREEWEAVAAAAGVAPDALRLIRQVHGAAVAVLRRERAPVEPTPEADIIISDDPYVAIVVRVADCTPILLADRRLGVVGAVHAGWRGTSRRAAATAVAAMEREFGSAPADLVAAIGPCLGVCCGEVGEDVIAAFREAGGGEQETARWFSIGPGGRHHVNLVRANRDQLERAGLDPANIHAADLCTRSYPDVFHSYRAAGLGAGRMAAVIRCSEAATGGKVSANSTAGSW